MNYEYFYTATASGDLSVENPFNCAIEANNDLGEFYYLITRTNLGFTKVFKFGPVLKNDTVLPKNSDCSFSRIEPKNRKLDKIINDFLNQQGANISQAKEIDPEEAYENFVDFVAYMKDDNAF